MKTRDMILVALFAALTAIGAYITIPIPYVPITLQFFFCALSGVILGSKNGMLSQIVYVLIGLAGAPVFSGASGGIQSILKPSFGYIIGFVFAAYIAGIPNKDKNLKFTKILFYVIFSLLVDYLFGVSYLYMIMNSVLGKHITMINVLKIGVANFILGDFIKSILVALTAYKVVPLIKKAI